MMGQKENEDLLCDSIPPVGYYWHIST